MEVVKASQESIEEINDIILSAKRHWGYSEELIEIWMPDLLLTAESFHFKSVWLLKSEGECIGVVSVSQITVTSFELEDCWIIPKAIGTGAGRFIFEFVIDWLKTKDAKTLKIVADPNAAGFYKKMGACFIRMVPSKPTGREIPQYEFCF